jgi:hypothetical protein
MSPSRANRRTVLRGLLLATFLSAARLPFPLAAQETPANQAAPFEDFFELKVRPILAGTCLRCHGVEDPQGGLRVDSRAALLAGGEHGPAINVEQPQDSLLLHAVRRQGELAMPPDAPLPADEVAVLQEWITSGARWPEQAAQAWSADAHWALQPVRVVEAPQDPTGWAVGEIDRFVAARMHSRGLSPLECADRATLLRRASFDLLGLPPTPDEVDAFASDGSEQAFQRVVERLLASPRFGERWARHWMDVARYADTAGDNADYPVPEARLYRDYLIDSFNADKPFDQLVREQLAGDLLAAEDETRRAERIVATTFLGLSRRYATAPYELWHLTLEDSIDTIGRAFLGLSLKCARCHDHKYDPIPTTDYYALYGILASTQFPFAGAEEFASKQAYRQHFVPLVGHQAWQELQQQNQMRQQQLKRELEKLQAESSEGQALTASEQKLSQAKAEREQAASEAKPPIQTQVDELDRLRKEAKRAWETLAAPLREELLTRERLGHAPDAPVAYGVREGTLCDVPVQLNGDPQTSGVVVPRGVPQHLGGPAVQVPPDRSGRLELAQWLASPQNPWTARVYVNRVWQHLLGRGIVATPSNFGVRGAAPTHPELLDYLTADFVASGWSTKHLVRQIVLSKCYQLASDPPLDNPLAAQQAQDPDNQYLWRHTRKRLDAESLRDAVLCCSGQLDLNRPGPHPFPPIFKWGWTQHNAFKELYPSRHRSIYLMTQRLQRHPLLALFDGADPNTSTDVRGSSTVALQALFFLNNPWFRQQSRELAARLSAAGGEVRQQIDRAHLICYGRHAMPQDLALAAAYFQQFAAIAAQSEPAAGEDAWTRYAGLLLSANEFLYVD